MAVPRVLCCVPPHTATRVHRALMRMKLGDYRFHRELCSQSGLWLSGLINKAVFPLSFFSLWVHVVGVVGSSYPKAVAKRL